MKAKAIAVNVAHYVDCAHFRAAPFHAPKDVEHGRRLGHDSSTTCTSFSRAAMLPENRQEPSSRLVQQTRRNCGGNANQCIKMGAPAGLWSSAHVPSWRPSSRRLDRRLTFRTSQQGTADARTKTLGEQEVCAARDRWTTLSRGSALHAFHPAPGNPSRLLTDVTWRQSVGEPIAQCPRSRSCVKSFRGKSRVCPPPNSPRTTSRRCPRRGTYSAIRGFRADRSRNKRLPPGRRQETRSGERGGPKGSTYMEESRRWRDGLFLDSVTQP